jgi:putative Holliday junction resolvase
LLAIDLGERRIGLAIGDTDTGSARPLATIRRATHERDAATLTTLCAEHRVDELVVGLPLNSDGSEGPQAALTREWGAQIRTLVGRPLAWRDERLTSVSAEQRLGPAPRGRSGGPPSAASRNSRRARIDREAAAAIAQAELDARRAG